MGRVRRKVSRSGSREHGRESYTFSFAGIAAKSGKGVQMLILMLILICVIALLRNLCDVNCLARPRLIKKITKEGMLKPKLTVAGQAESLRMAMRREEAKKGWVCAYTVLFSLAIPFFLRLQCDSRLNSGRRG